MTVTVKMSKDITPQSLKNAERNMGPRLKWNVLFKWYWSEWYRIKEKEVLNNLQCTSIMFFLKLLKGPPLDLVFFFSSTLHALHFPLILLSLFPGPKQTITIVQTKNFKFRLPLTPQFSSWSAGCWITM